MAELTIIWQTLLVSLSIVLPSSKAGDLIQLLGISSAAIGLAFRDIRPAPRTEEP